MMKWTSACAAAAIAVNAAVAAVDPIQVDPSTGRYVDSHGRTRIFHGMNVVYKKAPWYPPSAKFTPTDSLDGETMDNLRVWGFNIVRLGVMWPGVEPAPNQIDHDYLRAIMKLSDGLAQRGVYTIADLHQDVGSRRFCGEGVPEHYVDALLADSTSKLSKAPRFPRPIMDKSKLPMNASGYPNLDDCQQHAFAQYYLTYQVGALWNELYTPGSDMRAGFLRFWSVVATVFKDAPQLLAYELLNEPSGWCLDGDNLSCLKGYSETFRNDVEVRKLAPLYQAAAAAIRGAGARQTILYEPTVLPTIGGAPTFPSPPLGQDAQQGLAYHIYCAPGDGGGVLSDLICKATLDLYASQYFRFLKENRGVAGFMTEFGAVGGNPGELRHLDILLGKADEQFQSWAYWMLKKYGDFSTANPAESLYDAAGNLEEAKLKTLSRSYAPAIAGLPQRMAFDPDTGTFDLEFNATVTSAPTEIYLNEKLHYPSGFVVDVDPPNCLVQLPQVEANYLHLDLPEAAPCKGGLVRVSVRATAGVAEVLV